MVTILGDLMSGMERRGRVAGLTAVGVKNMLKKLTGRRSWIGSRRAIGCRHSTKRARSVLVFHTANPKWIYFGGAFSRDGIQDGGRMPSVLQQPIINYYPVAYVTWVPRIHPGSEGFLR